MERKKVMHIYTYWYWDVDDILLQKESYKIEYIYDPIFRNIYMLYMCMYMRMYL